MIFNIQAFVHNDQLRGHFLLRPGIWWGRQVSQIFDPLASQGASSNQMMEVARRICLLPLFLLLPVIAPLFIIGLVVKAITKIQLAPSSAVEKAPTSERLQNLFVLVSQFLVSQKEQLLAEFTWDDSCSDSQTLQKSVSSWIDRNRESDVYLKFLLDEKQPTYGTPASVKHEDVGKLNYGEVKPSLYAISEMFHIQIFFESDEEEDVISPFFARSTMYLRCVNGEFQIMASPTKEDTIQHLQNLMDKWMSDFEKYRFSIPKLFRAHLDRFYSFPDEPTPNRTALQSFEKQFIILSGLKQGTFFIRPPNESLPLLEGGLTNTLFEALEQGLKLVQKQVQSVEGLRREVLNWISDHFETDSQLASYIERSATHYRYNEMEEEEPGGELKEYYSRLKEDKEFRHKEYLARVDQPGFFASMGEAYAASQIFGVGIRFEREVHGVNIGKIDPEIISDDSHPILTVVQVDGQYFKVKGSTPVS